MLSTPPDPELLADALACYNLTGLDDRTAFCSCCLQDTGLKLFELRLRLQKYCIPSRHKYFFRTPPKTAKTLFAILNHLLRSHGHHLHRDREFPCTLGDNKRCGVYSITSDEEPARRPERGHPVEPHPFGNLDPRKFHYIRMKYIMTFND